MSSVSRVGRGLTDLRILRVQIGQWLRIRSMGQHPQRLFVFFFVDLQAHVRVRIAGPTSQPVRVFVGEKRMEARSFEEGMRESSFSDIRECFHRPHLERVSIFSMAQGEDN